MIGNHTLKGGVDIERIRFQTSQPTQPRGSYAFNGQFTGRQGAPNTGFGVADFLTNNFSSASISNVALSDDVRLNRSGYIQDNWKVSQRLTLNYGLRYDYYTPYFERHDKQAAFIPTSAPIAGHSTGVYLIPKSNQGIYLPVAFTRLLAADNIAIQYTANRYLTEPQKRNFGPRLGFAYQVTDKAVLHGGYGLFFGGLESAGYYPNLGENFPFEFDSGFAASSCIASGSCQNNGFTLETGFSNAIATGLLNSIQQPTLRGIDAKEHTPYSEQYNLTVEYALSNTFVGSIGYVGAVDRHLEQFPNPNGATSLAPFRFDGYTDNAGDRINPLRPYPHFGDITFTSYDGVASYNSLQTRLEKRAARGLSFLATYTYAHSLDDAPTPLDSTNYHYRSTNLFGIGFDYGNSPFDVRHRVTFNGNYELPFGRGRQFLNGGGPLGYIIGGWSNSLTFRAQTGEPITVGTNSLSSPAGTRVNAIRVGDPSKPGGTANSTNPGITCPTKVRTVQNWYNPCAFADPSPDNLGYTTSKYANSPSGQRIPNTVSGAAAFQYLGNAHGQTFGPGYNRLDASLFKSFATFRDQGLQFRMDIFNLLNTPAYGDPNNPGISSNGGLISNARFFQANTPDSRFFQFALKYTF